jgi:hypothetical protein
VIAAHAGLSLDDVPTYQSLDRPTHPAYVVAVYGRRPSAGRVNKVASRRSWLVVVVNDNKLHHVLSDWEV